MASLCWSWCCHGHITVHNCVSDCLSYRQYLQRPVLKGFFQCISWMYVPQEAICPPAAMAEKLSSRLQVAIRLTRLNETEIIHTVLSPLAKCHPVIQFCLFKIFLLPPSSLTQILSLILGLENCMVDHCMVLFATPQKLYLFDWKKIIGRDL